MKISIRILIILMNAIYVVPALGQQDSIHRSSCSISFEGIVLDGETNEPLPGATLEMSGVHKLAITDEHGNFAFKDVCPGVYQVKIEAYGYKSISSHIHCEQKVFRKFILHTDTCTLESLILEIEQPQPDNTQSTFQLKGRELDKVKGISLGEALKVIPGVNAVQTGPTIFKPVIQGMYGNRVLIMNNGIRLEGQQWGSEHAPEIDPYIASTITIVRGASGVRYGSDAIGGVILLDAPEFNKTPGIFGEVNLAGFFNNRGGATSGIINFTPKKPYGISSRLQGTFRRGGNSKTPDYYLKNTGFMEYNFSGAVAYNYNDLSVEVFHSLFNTQTGIFSGSHIGNLTDLQKAIQSDTPLVSSGFSYDIERPYQDVLHELTKVKVALGNGDNKWELIASRQFNNRAEFDSHKGKGEKPEVEFNITTHTATLVYLHSFLNKLKGEIGFTGIRQANTTSGTARSFIPNFKSYAAGVFVIERYKWNKFEWEAGIRYDFKTMEVFRYENNILVSPEFNFGNFSGAIGMICAIDSNWKFKSNFGTSFRPPTVNELYSDGLHHGSARLEYGNKNLQPEVAYNLNVSVQYFYRRTYGEISVYHNYINDYIYLTPRLKFDSASGGLTPDYVLTVRGAFPAFEYKQVNASFTGLDVTFNHNFARRFVVSSKASLLRAYNNTSNTYLIMTPPASFEYGIKYDWDISNKFFDVYLKVTNLLVARKSKVPSYEDFKEPPAGYSLLNCEAGFSLGLGSHPIDITFNVYNVLNTRYRDYLDRFRYFNDAVGRNFALRIKIPFEMYKADDNQNNSSIKLD